MPNKLLKNCAVVGAAGKMGSGISLLLLQEMARLNAELAPRPGEPDFRLHLIDANEPGLNMLRRYLRDQIIKYAEKNIQMLRNYYAINPILISNEEIIDAFTQGAMDMIRLDTSIESIKNSLMVFEAVSEDINEKVRLLSAIRSTSTVQKYYLTNTSSIPISVLDNFAELQHQIIGFHFYNPPAVQKLLEIIIPDGVNPYLQNVAFEMANRFGKKVVLSNDVAGFIGNGHLMHEITYSCEQVRKMAHRYTISMSDAIYIVNKITEKFLLRPMGIFQLIDYIGIDVCDNIASIMNSYILEAEFADPLIGSMHSGEFIGGHYPDGAQKDGFFRYQEDKATAVFSLETSRYVSFDNPHIKEVEKLIGSESQNRFSWKKLKNDPDKENKIKEHFQWLNNENSNGTRFALDYLENSREIAHKLVDDNVARSIDDVMTVLEYGFGLLYNLDSIVDFSKKR